MQKAKAQSAMRLPFLALAFIFVTAVILLALLLAPRASHAQGIVRGAQQGSYEGSRVAGPVGGIVGARSALGSAAPWAWSRACSARLIIAGGIHGARTNQVRRASPAASHVVSNVFPPARVNPAPLHLRPKIRQPLKRRRPHGPLPPLPPRRRSSHWSEHSH